MSLPPRQGLYDPRFEHDACGIGFVANVKGVASHEIVEQGLAILLNLVHRGATGCDPLTGDGAGILIQMPHEFFKAECAAAGIELPEPGQYAIGNVHLPVDLTERRQVKQIFEDKILATGQRLLGWRKVPVDAGSVGPMARSTAPTIRQAIIGSTSPDNDVFERKLFVVRKWAERSIRESSLVEKSKFYVPSLSSRTIIYKGLLLAEQLAAFYRDLANPTVVSALAMVHQRFSTNTFPTWELAQPFRTLCHNGEINTLSGNVNWMHAREQLFDGGIFGKDVRHLLPTIAPGLSDSATLDAVAELLMHAGRPLPHVMMMLVPEAWENDEQMSRYKRDFYEYHSCLMEPWDGPAALCFTDGRKIGAVLDRNGLRPARWLVTKDDIAVVASETGVLGFPPERILRKGRLQPGRMFLVDLEKRRIVEDEEIKDEVCGQKPYGRWLHQNKIRIGDIEAIDTEPTIEETPLLTRQKLFGYSQEDLRIIMAPMAEDGQEPVGSMGTDSPLAVLSDRPQLLFNYFKQHFAQVTNPAIDPIREELVMSLKVSVGGEGNVLLELPDQAQMLELPHPVLTTEELSKIRDSRLTHIRKPMTVPALYSVAEGGAGLKKALDEMCRLASVAVLNGHSLVILSDRGANQHVAPIPSLLATGAVHHHLERNGQRMRVGLIVETGEAREVHHFCLLTGYGAGAINPYVALETIDELVADKLFPEISDEQVARDKYIKAINKGILKVMSKMGISTLRSYQGAQIFECLGLSPEVVEPYFTGTTSRISGIDLEVLAEECRMRHEAAFPTRSKATTQLDIGGVYHYRAQGERHLWTPQTVASLQRAVRSDDAASYDEFARAINEQTRGLITLRGMWDTVAAETPLPLDQVEPAEEIVKRFATGAMSFGSISREAHENLAVAMNRIGGKSNTGEGGEIYERFVPLANGDSKRSAIKQVASGRFGVTSYYLTNADELQIKVAQGAKPGEGGQLPGHKVDAVIAKVRHSTPGVSLISPPPHHDIYSIEDLAQLIHDLKNANPSARISVKLVAEAGVGTVAAGVSKAHADVVLISGWDGGTGASPQTSLKHAGVPWELGLAETHQVLVKNDLRSRIVVQADGQLRTGRDVAIAALLGAEEFGFSTAPLVASGCIMMRKCHLNTCPVGIATQNPELRKKFTGTPEHVIRYFFFIAEELRALMAEMGFRTVNEMIGRTDRLKTADSKGHWKASKLDFSDVLMSADAGPGVGVYKQIEQDHGLDGALDNQIIEKAQPALERGEKVKIQLGVRNVHRTIGAMLAHEISKRYADVGLPDETIELEFTGSAGQSFGAFMVRGMSILLDGDANDYAGKGMSGGVLVLKTPDAATYEHHKNMIVGNVVLYGATGGKAFFNGMAGERFCVRNSGVAAVVEGAGDHCCEYMTGGRVVVIGPTGKNFGAGMSGGYAYVLDEEGKFESRVNPSMVELEPLSPEDAHYVASLLDEHRKRTNSRRADALLGRWEETITRFIKVVPIEYRRVLDELSRKRADDANKMGGQVSSEPGPEGGPQSIAPGK